MLRKIDKENLKKEKEEELRDDKEELAEVI